MKKRVISMLLVLCMLLSMMPSIMVSAAEGDEIAGLKDVFSKHFKIGTALSASEARKAQAQEFTLKHFNSVTCENEMKPDTMLDQAASQRMGDNVSTQVRLTDNTRVILEFCEENNIPMRGHVFVWYSQTPAWFFREGFTNDGDYVDVATMDQRLENYFKNLFALIETEFPDLTFYAWDIVNEAFTDSNPSTMRPANQSNWVRIYGDDSFIYKAFAFAREYAPEGCKLYYNDYNEYETGKLAAMYELCKNLYDQGLLDGVGMQSHLGNGYPSIENYRKALEKYASIGCEISVTELDVQDTNEDSQAAYYEQLFEVLLDYEDQIDAVVFWGTMDDVSWRSSGKPLLFNGQYEPKKAYYSVIDTVADHEHIYEATVVEPTCTEEGYTANVCSICGRNVIKETTKALGHKWDEGKVTLEPTETSTGIRTYDCERCDATKTSRIPRIGSTVPDSIDFTDPASADAFEIVNQTSTEIREDDGLYMISTMEAVETANGQLSGDAATTPRDLVTVSAEGDWIATLKFKFDQGSSPGYYEFFGFYATDDYDNMVGIRGGDGAIQDFLRKDGTVTAETKNATPGLKSASAHWFRIEKAGDNYVCYRSTDGETFEEIFAFEETGITGDTIVIDAYSGMSTGYNYTLESLEFEEGETGSGSECQHDYKDGVCGICGAKDPNHVPEDPEKPEEPIKIACIGDSITYGHNPASPTGNPRITDNWPKLLGDMLGEGYDVRNFGRNGATLSKNGQISIWNIQEFTDSKNFNPDIVIIKLGTNDYGNTGTYAATMREFVGIYRDLPSSPEVYIATCAMPYEPGAFGIQCAPIKNTIVPMQRELAEELGCGLIDVHAATADMPENFPDYIHPNVDGHRVIAQTVYNVLMGTDEPEDPIDHSIPIYENTQYSFEERAADLLGRMTLNQKLGFTTHSNTAINASALGGGALNVPGTKNLGAYTWWNEALHGFYVGWSGQTANSMSYPQSITVGTTWNPALYYQEASAIGDELRERCGKNEYGNARDISFYSPTVNMQRDPRWGRNEESYSEDPLLVSKMGEQFILGMEGKDQDGNLLDPDGYYKVHTTLKHYTLNNSERNRLNGSSNSDLRAIREYYTAPYRNIIQSAHVSSIMTSYNAVNTEPASYSSYLMDTLLRQTFGFKGYVTSDCDSVSTMVRLNYVNPRTGQTLTNLEQFGGAMAHGEDIECAGGHSNSGSYSSLLGSVIDAGIETDKGVFTENTLDVSVHRILTARLQTGEIDDNLAYTNAANERIAAQKAAKPNSQVPNQTDERLAINDAVVNEAVVLLKNDGVLPLSIPAEGDFRVAIVGTWQTQTYFGLYTASQNISENWITIQQGIVNAVRAVNPNAQFDFITGYSLAAADTAKVEAADVAIVVTGTDGNYSKEDGDRTSIALSNNQAKLISDVGKLNDKTIAVMETCGPMQVTTFEDDVNAILWSSFGGLRKGVGFGNVITGAVNPSGHLTSTWHQNVSDTGVSDIPDILDYTLYATEGRSGRTYMYYVGETEPSYPFGYGLSYTTFEYSNLKIDKTKYDANETVKVSFDIKNTGDVAGKDVAQLYIAQPDAPAELLRPIRRLEGFEKIELQPGETKTIEMEVAIPDLAFFSEELDHYAVDTGRYQVQVGEDSAHADLTVDFTVSGELDEYPELLTVKANQVGDTEIGIEERIIYDKGAIINPQLTVAMNNEKLYGYIIADQQSPIHSLKSTPLPEGMTFSYESNRPYVVAVDGDEIKAVGPGVATVTVTGELDGHVVTADFVVYVVASANLDGITINGEPMEGFARDKYVYELSDEGFNGKVPTVAAVSSNEDLTITVTQPDELPGTATIVAEYGETGLVATYRIGFGHAPVTTDFAEGWEAAKAKSWKVINGNNNAAFGDDGLTITGEAGALNDGTAKNVYVESATGEWVAQTHLTLAAAISGSGKQAGLVIYDGAENNIRFVVEGNVLRVYNNNSQAASINISGATDIHLQAVKQGTTYGFNYSLDGMTWNAAAANVTNIMALPQIGVFAVGEGVNATFDGINISKVSNLYPRLDSLSVDGKPVSDFNPETFVYNFEVKRGAAEAPVIEATAEEGISVNVAPMDAPTGTTTITAYTDVGSTTYTICFGYAPVSDYFADGDFNADVWEVLRENKNTYQVNKGEGVVLPTQRYDIYSTGAAWENCFVAPAMGNWEVVAKLVYPQIPNASYQQAMLLVWQDEDNYIRMNCQESQLKLEPGVETNGSFSANLGSGNAVANADGTVTLYYMIKKEGNNYTIGYSQDGVVYKDLGTARNIDYVNPKIGLFATMNNSGSQINANFEYVAATWLGGVQQMTYDAMLTWAAQNVADYVAADLPAETVSNLSFSEIPHGYTMKVESSDPTVIADDGTVLPSSSDKNVDITITISEGATSATARKTIKVLGTGGNCDHEYESVVVEPTCTEEGYTTNTCGKCGETIKTNTVPALGHDWDNGVVTKPATETEDGEKLFTCGRCGETRTETIPATGKVDMSDIDFTDPASANRFTVDNQEATAIREGEGLYLVTTTDSFEDCNGQISTFVPKDVVKIPVKGDWQATMKFDFSTAGAANGYYQFFGFYAAEGDDYQNLAGIRGGDGAMQNFLRVDGAITADSADLNSSPGLASNGTYWWRIVKEDTTYTCYRSEDGENFTEMFSYEATGIEADSIIIDAYTGMTEGYEFVVDSISFEGGSDECEHDYEAVVIEPTCTEQGFSTQRCSRCGITIPIMEDFVDALGHDYKDGICTRCGDKDSEYHDCPSAHLTDIPAYGNWAHAGIDYCVESGLMEGIGGNTFNPKGTLTRAELITVIYRAAGKPAVEYKNVFSDVPAGAWYTDAVEWAAAEGIVEGTGNGKFDPTGVITREQLATMLYRYAGSPEVEGNLDAFPDKAAVRAYAVDAMIWATSEGIVTGASIDDVIYLVPETIATREQIATIMMRYLTAE